MTFEYLSFSNASAANQPLEREGAASSAVSSDIAYRVRPISNRNWTRRRNRERERERNRDRESEWENGIRFSFGRCHVIHTRSRRLREIVQVRLDVSWPNLTTTHQKVRVRVTNPLVRRSLRKLDLSGKFHWCSMKESPGSLSAIRVVENTVSKFFGRSCCLVLVKRILADFHGEETCKFLSFVRSAGTYLVTE